MNRFLTGNEWNWRLARTIVQGILAVSCAAVTAAALGKSPTALSALAVVAALIGVLAGRLVFYALHISVGIFF